MFLISDLNVTSLQPGYFITVFNFRNKFPNTSEQTPGWQCQYHKLKYLEKPNIFWNLGHSSLGVQLSVFTF